MKKLSFLLLFLSLYFIRCDEENPYAPILTIPTLSELRAPEILYLNSKLTFPMSIRVEDPQGINDIDVVTCSLQRAGEQNPFKSIALVDDGTEGDIIPLDGVFTSLILPKSMYERNGDYTLIFQARDKSGNESDVKSHQVKILEGEGNTPPVISSIEAPLMVHMEDTTDYSITAEVSDPQGLNDIHKVLLQIFPPNSPNPLFSDTLRNNGKEGDVQAGDSLFTLLIHPDFSRSIVGKFSFRFQAFDQSGDGSNVIVHVADVVKAANNPPYIFDLQAPTILNRVSGYVVIDTIRISVMDPQGLSDIRDVYFRSFKPDGYEAQNSPIHLADDGKIEVDGDKIADDGIYSVIIQLPFEAQPGNYTFIFEAIDRSNTKSNRILHTLEII